MKSLRLSRAALLKIRSDIQGSLRFGRTAINVKKINLRGISSSENDALLVGELDLLVFTCEVEGSNALLAIKAKEEALSQPVEVEGLPPGLATVGTEDLTLCISYQEHCIVTVLNV